VNAIFIGYNDSNLGEQSKTTSVACHHTYNSSIGNVGHGRDYPSELAIARALEANSPETRSGERECLIAEERASCRRCLR
jgi:hypothetical protein